MVLFSRRRKSEKGMLLNLCMDPAHCPQAAPSILCSISFVQSVYCGDAKDLASIVIGQCHWSSLGYSVIASAVKSSSLRWLLMVNRLDIRC